jgi:hypothetical protein
MESKHRENGVYRHRLAKHDSEMHEEQWDGDSKEPSEAKAVLKAASSNRRLEEKRALSEIQQDIAVDDEFESLKLKPTLVAPAVAASKFARNFVKGFKLYV